MAFVFLAVIGKRFTASGLRDLTLQSRVVYGKRVSPGCFVAQALQSIHLCMYTAGDGGYV